jgi:hypothetical protein
MDVALQEKGNRKTAGPLGEMVMKIIDLCEINHLEEGRESGYGVR